MNRKLFIAVLLFALVLASCGHAEGIATFADIPWDTDINDLQQTLQDKIGIRFHRVETEWQSDRYPPITYMNIPVYQVAACFDDWFKYISIWLTPFEIDSYPDGIIEVYDQGIANTIATEAETRFGKPQLGTVTLIKDKEETHYRIGSMEEMPYLLTDTMKFLMLRPAKLAEITIAYNSTILQYKILDQSDQEKYGNAGVYIVFPVLQYTSLNLLENAHVDDFEIFPYKQGEIQYANHF